MNSSTSSSDPVQSSRRIYLRILLTIVVGMSIAMGILYATVTTMGASSQSLLGRVIEARAAIPRIAAEENDLVMFYGSSMTRAAFSPREFDRDLAEMGIATTSFNFGIGGLNPMFQDIFSRRIAEDFAEHDRRLKLAIIEFNPFQTTITRRQGAVALEEAYTALLASPAELMDTLLEDPDKGLRMLQIRYLRDGISAEATTTFLLAQPFMEPRPETDLKEEEGVEEKLNEVLEKMNEAFEREYPDYDGSDWYYPWRGGGTIMSERPQETIELVYDYYKYTQTDYQMTRDRLQRIHSADIEDLHFDPDLVEHFIALVKNFQGFSDHVEVVMLPKNTDWIKNPPEALERQAAVVAQIEAATGVTVRDYQEIEMVTNDMFGDTTHLNRYQGAVNFTRHLVNEYADLLR